MNYLKKTRLLLLEQEELFNNIKGVFVPVSETVRSFKEILEGKYDDLPEQAFLYVGTIEDAVKKAQMLKEEK